MWDGWLIDKNFVFGEIVNYKIVKVVFIQQELRDNCSLLELDFDEEELVVILFVFG